MRYLVVAIVVSTAVLLVGGAPDAMTSSERSSACAPGYRPCLPVRADLDCGQINDALTPVRVTGNDPYGLDRDKDGLGCEIGGQGGGTRSPWGLILRKPPRKEALIAKVGDTLTVAGWSPSLQKGKPFELCVRKPGGRCRPGKRGLTGTVQVLGTWKVARGDVSGGFLRLMLRAAGRNRADDSVRIT
jgi:hypothetical protein